MQLTHIKLILLPLMIILFPIISFAGALPYLINPPGERLILVDPVLHAWGAYTADGVLVRSGLASCGANWCKDTHRPCHTNVGVFRIRSLGDSNCVSPSFPLPNGGAPMPYCMYYTPYQALHGSPHVVHGNISHGCVRIHPQEARWIRNNFATIGTLIVIRPY